MMYRVKPDAEAQFFSATIIKASKKAINMFLTALYLEKSEFKVKD